MTGKKAGPPDSPVISLMLMVGIPEDWRFKLMLRMPSEVAALMPMSC